MSNLAVIENKQVSIWEGKENLAQIKEIFAPTLTPLEFTIFVEMGKATGLSPFLKEIWAVKYDASKPAQIFIGRDGYRKSAQRHPHYDFHSSDAVYSNDAFEVKNGEVSHKYSMKDRGTLMGAYCTVARKGSSRPTYVFVDLKEYSTGKSLWNQQTGKPATMIKKVAEAQALKMAFQELFAGSYNEFEAYESEEDHKAKRAGKGVSGLKERLGLSKPEPENEPIEAEFNEVTGEINDFEEEEEETDIEPPIPNSEEDLMATIEILMENSTSIKELMEPMKMAKDLSSENKKKVSILFNKRQNDIRNK